MSVAPIENKVLSIIDERRAEIVEYLRKLIMIPSITGNEKQVQKCVANKLREIGLMVDVWEPDWEELKTHPAYVPVEIGYIDRPNVVGTLKGAGGGKSLLLNGHIDVVPPGPGWKRNPWGAEIEDEKIYGRGASDMKGGVASMIMALDCFLRAGVRPKGDVIVETVVDEETGGNGTLACVMRGYKADAGIVTEHSNLEVQPAHTGSSCFVVKVKGRSASLNYKWTAVDPIKKACKIYRSLSDLEVTRQNTKTHPFYDPRELYVAPSIFKAGISKTILPEEAEIAGVIRCLPGETVASLRKEFEEHIQRVSELDPWLRDNPPEIQWVGYFSEPSEIPVDHWLTQTVAEAFRRATGAKPTISGHLGGCDVRFLTRYAETPTLIFSPGLMEQMHAVDEFVRIEDVITAVKVLALTILNVCGYERILNCPK